MNASTFRVCAFVLACGIAGAASAQSSALPSLQDRFELAMQAYETQHFQSAYDQLVRLADEGHAEAARIALLMARYGRPLYGIECAASGTQRVAWTRTLVAAR